MELTPANVTRCLASEGIDWSGVRWAYDKWSYDDNWDKDRGYKRSFWTLFDEAKNAIVAVEVRKRGKGEFDAMECDCTNCLAKAIPRFISRLHVRLAHLIFRELSPPKKKAKV